MYSSQTNPILSSEILVCIFIKQKKRPEGDFHCVYKRMYSRSEFFFIFFPALECTYIFHSSQRKSFYSSMDVSALEKFPLTPLNKRKIFLNFFSTVLIIFSICKYFLSRTPTRKSFAIIICNFFSDIFWSVSFFFLLLFNLLKSLDDSGDYELF